MGDGAPFDLITLDIDMPEMDGTEVLYRIREMETNFPKENRVKIFMITGHSNKNTVITSIQAGCDDCIAKPFKRKTVLEKIEQLRLDD